MPRTRTQLRAVTLVAAATVVAGVGAVTYQASAAEVSGGPRPHPSASPSPIDPPAGLRKIASFRVASGTQTYTCTAGKFTGASVPEAQLVGPRDRIHHFKGRAGSPNATAPWSPRRRSRSHRAPARSPSCCCR